jgi:hypothetical protein
MQNLALARRRVGCSRSLRFREFRAIGNCTTLCIFDESRLRATNQAAHIYPPGFATNRPVRVIIRIVRNLAVREK